MANNGSQLYSLYYNSTIYFLLQNSSVSATVAPPDDWQAIVLARILPYILIILSVAITFCNSVVLAAFVKNSQLCTPFNCYLISLIISDIGQATLDLPFTVLNQFAPIWPLGHIPCNFYLYTKWVFSGVVRNTHALISLNRVWALFWPVAYKQYHTRTVAIWLCVGTWVYVHIWLMPGMVPDAVYLRPDDGTCFVNTAAQQNWALATQFLLYNSTLVVVVVTYPFIWWKIRQRQLKTAPSNATASKKTEMTCEGSSLRARNSSIHGSSVVDGVVSQPESTAEVGKVQAVKLEQLRTTNSGKVGQPLGPKKSQSFAVLTYLVLGVVFCWSPIMLFFTMEDINGYDNNIHFIVGSMLYYFNSLLDPIFFCSAIRPLRATVLGFFRCRR